MRLARFYKLACELFLLIFLIFPGNASAQSNDSLSDSISERANMAFQVIRSAIWVELNCGFLPKARESYLRMGLVLTNSIPLVATIPNTVAWIKDFEKMEVTPGDRSPGAYALDTLAWAVTDFFGGAISCAATAAAKEAFEDDKAVLWNEVDRYSTYRATKVLGDDISEGQRQACKRALQARVASTEAYVEKFYPDLLADTKKKAEQCLGSAIDSELRADAP
jgi:hypothetical protein